MFRGCTKSWIANQSNRRSHKWAAISMVLVVAAIGLGANLAIAQETFQGKPLRVAVKPIEPFVFRNGTELTGFSIDLWNAIAQSLKVETTWVDVSTVGEQ